MDECIPGLTSLINLGNTCFMNSALQCLSNTTNLRNYFLEGKYRHELNRGNPLGTDGVIAELFAELIREIWGAQQPSIDPCKLKAAIYYNSQAYAENEQQDCQEFLVYLLDALHEDLNRAGNVNQDHNPVESDTALGSWERYKSKNDSFIVDTFQGQYRSTVTCTRCHKLSVSYEPFMYLTLPVSPSRTLLKTITLEQCFKEFTKEEQLGEDNRWFCANCQEYQQATKRIELWRLPEILIIHLKRFCHAASRQTKVDMLVDFPLDGVDLNPWLTKSSGNMTYTLYATVNHFGCMESGHYTAFASNESTKCWFEFNDAHIRKIDPISLVDPSAYMLFYKLQNDPVVAKVPGEVSSS
ncbi:cysteine proteinase [Basidiobolus meristosporus CBS 931.73]|uniref:Cysteine proteinase n=1 Tax=Basidiobolus meristosporus CBS 931.73 TaxID=1314790 RepID=A0A1Y1XHB0_9FUNG|nr:cysteine proteinase [Basidiobolus meristosporus CBS 931.73]|eukprot:ORX84786.1 cysteine proteinase [Basidiobolus meristosporus CBS 931.73]